MFNITTIIMGVLTIINIGLLIAHLRLTIFREERFKGERDYYKNLYDRCLKEKLGEKLNEKPEQDITKTHFVQYLSDDAKYTYVIDTREKLTSLEVCNLVEAIKGNRLMNYVRDPNLIKITVYRQSKDDPHLYIQYNYYIGYNNCNLETFQYSDETDLEDMKGHIIKWQ